jgi:DnaJ-domain-containing protein 1
MSIFGRLFGRRSPAIEPSRFQEPPRIDVLQVPDVDPDSVRQALRARAPVQDEAVEDVLRVYSASRYEHATGPEELGPKYDPFDVQQSRAARVHARRARARSDGPRYDRRSVGPNVSREPTKPVELNHYQVLGVQRDAPIGQIEGAYRRYAATIHPDKFFDNPPARARAEAKLRELNAMMTVLRDPMQRAEYDASI